MRSHESRLAGIERLLPDPRQGPLPDPVVPNIIDFVVSERYLNRPHLYPRQATLLKLIFLQEHLFTPYDRTVIAEWSAGVRQGTSELVGGYGVAQDVMDRIAICKREGRQWFREVVAAVGRRGSKGYLGSLSVSYVLWNYLATGDPQQHYGIAKDKVMTAQVFAGNKEQARDVLWRDLYNVITAGPCFEPYLADDRVDKLSLWSPAQIARGRGRAETPAFEIVAKEATESAGRGPASFVQAFDEMAHSVGAGSSRSAEEIYIAATPALAQFGVDAFAYLPSSPRHMTGQFFESFSQGMARDSAGSPMHPEVLACQFPSWELYRDWELAATLQLYPGGPNFEPLDRPVIAEADEDLQRFRDTNPETYLVEFEAQWAEVDRPYLRRDKVLAMFGPVGDQPLTMQEARGSLRHNYVAHVDLSLVDDNTALAIAHAEPGDDQGRPDLFVDLIRTWEPAAFPDGHIHLGSVEAELKRYLIAFNLARLTFDQWNSQSMIENLRDFATEKGLRTEIGVVSATQTSNRAKAENFKAALYEGRVHSPPHQLAQGHCEVGQLQCTTKKPSPIH